jgi:hypothetical protein
VLFALVAGCAPDEHCPGGEIDDPGAASTPELFGRVDQLVRGQIIVAGTAVSVDANTTSHRRCSSPLVPEQCYAFVALDDDGTATEIWYLSAYREPLPVNELDISTATYRVEDDTVVLDDGLGLALDDRFRVRGCDVDGREGLARARFSATFYVNTTTGQVVRAGCNGCA